MKLNIAMPVDNDGDAIEDGAEDSDEWARPRVEAWRRKFFFKL